MLSIPREPARELPFRDGNAGFSLTLKRNCSISPAGLAGVFAALACVVVAIGAGFAVAGAWLVLPFAGLEVLLLGWAYVVYARRAADYERIELDSGRLTVEVGEAQKTWRYEMDARRARVRRAADPEAGEAGQGLNDFRSPHVVGSPNQIRSLFCSSSANRARLSASRCRPSSSCSRAPSSTTRSSSRRTRARCASIS